MRRKQFLGLVEMTLVRQDLALVVAREGRALDIARAFLRCPAARIVIERLVPLARVVGMDPEVVQDDAEPRGIVELLVDAKRLLVPARVESAQMRERGVDQVVGVRE